MPASGKSKVVDMLHNRNNTKWHIIRPSDWIPENIAVIDEESQRAYNTACWSLAIEKAHEAICDINPKEIIVLDTCNSKYNTVVTLIADAKSAMHRVVLLFVQSTMQLCLERNAGISEALLRTYMDSFKISLPKYKKACDMFVVIKNIGTLEKLETELHEPWKKLCQNI